MDRHDTLLISCAVPENRKLLRSILEKRCNLLEAADTQQTLLLLNQNADCIAALIMDITDPGRIDRKLLEQPEAQNRWNRSRSL